MMIMASYHLQHKYQSSAEFKDFRTSIIQFQRIFLTQLKKHLLSTYHTLDTFTTFLYRIKYFTISLYHIKHHYFLVPYET